MVNHDDYRQATEAELAEERRRIDEARAASQEQQPPKLRLIEGGRA
jgi:hypothetical protein